MMQMKLGAPILSPARMLLRTLLMFAAWESPVALESFLAGPGLGRQFARGWHLRMNFLRRWGSIKELGWLPETEGSVTDDHPVAAVTVARMRLRELPRFIHWGRPVEQLVRDHPGKTFATAGMRWPRTVSTFSVWKSQAEMLAMVRGHGKVPDPARHRAAMAERERRDFHFEFTTLRFAPLGEYGVQPGKEL
jgi:hypothetical protein